jgi:hypothetical protein
MASSDWYLYGKQAPSTRGPRRPPKASSAPHKPRKAKQPTWILYGPQNPGTRRISPNTPLPHGVPGTTYTTGQTSAAATAATGYSGLSDADILAQAQAQADAQLGVQSASIQRAAAAARAAAERDRQAIAGLGFAQAGMMKNIPAEIAAIANQGGQAIAGYGAGYAGEIGHEVQQGEQQNAADVAAQTGGTDPGAPTVDPSAVQNAIYAQGGAIPATEETEMGVASANAAAGMPAVVQRAADEDIQQRMAQAASEDADYRQQLLDLNAQRPGLVQDAVDRLNAIEDRKRGLAQDAQDREDKKKQQEFENSLALGDQQRQDRAELAQEAALGDRAAAAKLAAMDRADRTAIAKTQLKLKQAKQAADLRDAEAKGHKIDAAASKVMGYVVDVEGNPVLDSHGSRIPVQQSPKDKKKSHQTAIKQAGEKALGLRGNAVKAAELVKKPNGKTGPPAGQYAGRPGAKGLFPDGTTNDPNRAQHDGGMTFNQAQAYLMQTYGLSRAEARKILVATGWRPGT